MNSTASEQRSVQVLDYPDAIEVVDVSATSDGPPLGVAPPRRPDPVSSPRVRGWGRNVVLGFGALGLVVATTAVALVLPHLDEGTGDRTYNPTTFAELEHDYRFGVGTLTVDLRDVDFPTGTHLITVDHGIGSARVLLPADVDYDVTTDVAAGESDVFGDSADGDDQVNSGYSVDTADTVVVVDLDVEIGYGRVSQDEVG